jgi:hypothetical protein
LHSSGLCLSLDGNMAKSLFVLFIDLVRVFDTVDHKVLLTIFRRYGIPARLIKVIQKMYECLILNVRRRISLF